MANFIIILILELVAVAALIVFDGVLNSKYYEHKPIEGLSTETVWALGLMMLTGFVWSSQKYGNIMPDASVYMLLLGATQLAFHAWLVYILAKAFNAFLNIKLESDLQYYLARFLLFLSITMEGLAIFGICFLALYHYHTTGTIAGF